MKIDYDGINFEISEMQNLQEKQMIKRLLEAMRDGEVEKCNIYHAWEICDQCDGEGKHSKHLGVISAETLYDDWDDEIRDSYFSGGYDRSCTACSGSGKIKVIDEDSLNESAQQWIKEYRTSMYEYLMERKSEMMFGC